MNTATQIRRQLQSLALREVTHQIDKHDADRLSGLLWRRAYRLGLDQDIRRQLGLCAQERLT